MVLNLGFPKLFGVTFLFKAHFRVLPRWLGLGFGFPIYFGPFLKFLTSFGLIRNLIPLVLGLERLFFCSIPRILVGPYWVLPFSYFAFENQRVSQLSPLVIPLFIPSNWG